MGNEVAGDLGHDLVGIARTKDLISQLVLQARTAGHTLVEPDTVLLTHLSELARRYAPDFLTRAETERLVELALDRLPTDADLRLADLGTGSGAIALAIASQRPQAPAMREKEYGIWQTTNWADLASLVESVVNLVIGFVAGIPKLPANQVLLRNRRVTGVDWGGWAGKNPGLNDRMLAQVMELIAAGELQPVEPQTYPLEQAAQALQDLEDRKVAGKIALIP